jgi:hypothetical protein
MITEILSYVPNHKPVTLTCKTFNEIICEYKVFVLKFIAKRKDTKHFAELLDNDEIFHSMMQSSRRFNSLSIINKKFDQFCEFHGVRLERLAQIIERFGKNIKELSLHYIKLPLNFIELLNNMPLLQKIKLVYIKVNDATSMVEGKLKLFKLKKFEGRFCSIEAFNIFNNLPNGVLQELTLTCGKDTTNSTTQLFSNQPNITKIIAHPEYTKLFNWSQTKLKWLEVCNGENLATILEGQNEIEYLACSKVNQSMLNLICNSLKSLTELRLQIIDKEALPNFLKLRKLKKLSINFFFKTNNNSFLSFIRSNSVEKLRVSNGGIGLKELTIVQLSLNFPKLKELNFHEKVSIKNSFKILQNFPNLESLNLGFYSHGEDDEVFIYQEGLKHNKLKKLSVSGWKNNSKALAKLIRNCTQLEELHLSFVHKVNFLKEVLNDNLQSLKILEVFSKSRDRKPYMFSDRDIAVLKENGKNLEKFTCNCCIFVISETELREKFRDQFKYIEIIKPVSSHRRCVSLKMVKSFKESQVSVFHSCANSACRAYSASFVLLIVFSALSSALTVFAEKYATSTIQFFLPFLTLLLLLFAVLTLNYFQ